MDFLDSNAVVQLKTFLATKGADFGMNVAAAAAIFVLGRIGARMLAKTLARILERGGTETTLVRFLHNLLYALMLVFIVVASLERLGVNTTSFAAIVAAAGLAIGLALQGSLSNFAAGVMIILMRHFVVGDVIEAAGQKGTVSDIQIFSSVLTLEDGTRIIIPNNGITSGTIKVFPRAVAKSEPLPGMKAAS